MKQFPSKFRAALITFLIIVFLIPIIAHGNSVYKNSKSDSNISYSMQTSIKSADNNALPTVGNYENFKKLLQSSEKIKPFFKVTFATAEMADTKATKNEYSNTNIQVEGVDESDIVKTDGEYVYHVNNDKLVVVKAYPANEMRIVKIIKYNAEEFYPNDIYVYNNNLIVIGRKYVNISVKNAPQNNQTKIMSEVIRPIVLSKPITKVIVYDISNKENIKIKRTIEVEGDYLTSRMINSKFYMITNKYIYDYRIMEDVKPVYKDSAYKSGKENEIDFKDIKYFPGYVEPNYMLISSFDILKEDKVDVQTYLGSGQNAYVSMDNIYVTVSEYQVIKTNKTNAILPNYNVNTIIYKFNIKNDVKFVNSGKVPGSILNQFSMDEYNGYFRIATTKGFSWLADENTSKNNLYILDSNLKIVGRIEDIALGESIKSTRFLGDKVYIVTYKNVDPLFVIDTKDVENPKILGYLKIPGFSTYLHPYDENHVIGFGIDTKDVNIKDLNGKNATITIQNGLKMSMFDVSDFENPKEMYSEVIGDRGSYSELLYNHKALLFSKEKGIFAFPVTIYEAKDKEKPLDYGRFAFQGAYVYNINLEKGFELKGKITHLTDEDYKNAGDFQFDYNKTVQRTIYINDVLYTISNAMIKANDINTMKEINSLEIK